MRGIVMASKIVPLFYADDDLENLLLSTLSAACRIDGRCRRLILTDDEGTVIESVEREDLDGDEMMLPKKEAPSDRPGI
jgi:hypothetical protein